MSHVVFLYHIVWRTKKSEMTISSANERDLYAYILGICNSKNCKLFRIGGIANHIHMLISIKPDISVSEFMRVLKTETSKWMSSNQEKFPLFKGWGNGYAAFTYSENDRETIFQYIKNQKEHHKRHNFDDEYRSLLKEWGIDPDSDLFLKDD